MKAAQKTPKKNAAGKTGAVFSAALSATRMSAPLGLIAIILVAGGERRLAVFSLGTIVLTFFGYAVIYWIGILEIHTYLDTTVVRLIFSCCASARSGGTRVPDGRSPFAIAFSSNVTR